MERLLTQGDIRGLCRALRHRDTLVRRRAVQALGELAEPEGLPCLVRALRDSDQYVQRWAIQSLAQIGSEDALDHLTSMVFASHRQHSALAAQALATLEIPQAQAALELRDILTRNDWGALATIGEAARRPLLVILRSEQCANWPSAKRKGVLAVAVQQGLTPPLAHRRELAEMGLFVSGVHTVGDLLAGLGSRSPGVQSAAAEKLATLGQAWVKWPLYWRLKREQRLGKSEAVVVALARALTQLGDDRALEHYKKELNQSDGKVVSHAARILAGMGSPESLEPLFWFVLSPPPPPANRHSPLVFSALVQAGANTVEVLQPLLEHEDTGVRRLMLALIVEAGHPEATDMLGRVAREDPDPALQLAAVDSLAHLDTAEAVETLTRLIDALPQEWITHALARTTHPVGVRNLRELVPDATTLHGILQGDDKRPLANVAVQIVRKHPIADSAAGNWQAISPRAQTDAGGAFSLPVLNLAEGEAVLCLKVTTPPKPDGTASETFTANLPLVPGQSNRVQAHIDRFFNRLIVKIGRAAPEE